MPFFGNKKISITCPPTVTPFNAALVTTESKVSVGMMLLVFGSDWLLVNISCV